MNKPVTRSTASRFWSRWLSTGITLVLLFAVQAVRAQISFVDMFRSDFLLQTGNGSSLTNVGFRFDAGLFSVNADDFSAAQMAYPGPASPVGLASITPTFFAYQSGILPSQAVLDAEFPFGTYQFNADGPAGPDSASFDYLADSYPQSLPFLTGTNFTDLQGVNPAAPFAFEFSPLVVGGPVTESFIFFTIFDQTAASLAFDAGFLAPTTTGLVLPGGTLQTGHNYSYELIFSNRQFVPSPGAQFSAVNAFDLRTSGRFTAGAAVPEPSFLALFAGPALLAGYGLRRRIRR
jgi:hypothetical protein